ncbi:hypothetical protein ACJMK2_025784, partial [Sinanodonta woodiana]
ATVFSSPPGENQGARPEQYWIVPIIIFGFLLTAGIVICFKCWSKISIRGNGIQIILLCTTENSDKNDATHYPESSTKSQDIIKSRHDNWGPNLQENMYTTIDE